MKIRPTTLQPRRSFVKTLLYGLALPGLWLARRLKENGVSFPEFTNPPIVVPYLPEPGIRFYDEVIVITTSESLSVFSSACPHLGCRINQSEAGHLVCPCHGSQFNDRGQVVRSPAARGLRLLKYEHDQDGATLRIFVERT